ncbi:hypothetical protein FACS189432_02540 [Bacteroidia bacterium]|nr:hypothetical protein FACS189426_00600 [Bacteroidia bacterium]GHT26995.1 hypothetical protein FACS189432_02540 [Bacteroidia bacterium]
MSKSMKFTAFFIEQYSGVKGMSGKDVYHLFKETGAFTYIFECAEALHTLGLPCLIEDVDAYIEKHANLCPKQIE